MNKCTVIVVIALQSTAVLADDHKEATEAAYCVGVHQSDIEFWRRTDPKSGETRDAELKQSRKQTFVEGAIKRGIIDRITVSRMRAVGYADAKSCLEVCDVHNSGVEKWTMRCWRIAEGCWNPFVRRPIRIANNANLPRRVTPFLHRRLLRQT